MPYCMKCKKRTGVMINGLCLKCDTDWTSEKLEFKINHRFEAGPDEFYIWVVKPKEWEQMKKKQ